MALYGSVPNRERFLVSLDRKYYDRDGDFSPNHFLYLNKKSLLYLLTRVGFTDVEFYNLDFQIQDIGHYLAFCLSLGVLNKFKSQKKDKSNIPT